MTVATKTLLQFLMERTILFEQRSNTLLVTIPRQDVDGIFHDSANSAYSRPIPSEFVIQISRLH